MKPVVSVVVVSDYASGDERGWEDLRATLKALAQQDFDEPAEVILVETAEFIREMPNDLLALLPGVRLVEGTGNLTYELMGSGVQAGSADIIGILEGDCAPRPGWLRAAVELMRTHPKAAAASGRTVYPDSGLCSRIMAVISRSFIDTGRTSRTRHLTHNTCVFRRSTLVTFPFPENIGPHMSSLHADAIERGGGELWFEPRMEIVHAYSGWEHERSMRHSLGYAVVRVRQQNRDAPHAWVIRMGVLCVPTFVLLRSLNAFRQCVRIGHAYGIAWYELPAAFVLSVAATALEARGMWNALHGLPVPRNKYR